MAVEIEALAARVRARRCAQRERAEDIAVTWADAPDDTIAETPREIHVILAEWRDDVS